MKGWTCQWSSYSIWESTATTSVRVGAARTKRTEFTTLSLYSHSWNLEGASMAGDREEYQDDAGLMTSGIGHVEH